MPKAMETISFKPTHRERKNGGKENGRRKKEESGDVDSKKLEDAVCPSPVRLFCPVRETIT